jgi:phage/plasmid primase-like uncharacterized protein
MTAAAALRARGISPKHFGMGTQRLACPECARLKYRPRDDALALTIEGDGHAVWFCHRCGLRGSTRGTDGRDRYARSANIIRLTDARISAERERQERKARHSVTAPHNHPYLARKRLPPAGLRYMPRFQSIERALLVALRDESGEIVNLQGINPEGEKRFLAGAQTRGAFALIGNWHAESPPARVAVGEGWATAAAFCAMYTAFLGVAAMSAANLPTVARGLRSRFPGAELVVLGDADAVGMRAAGEAAYLARAEIRAPAFMPEGSDWADFRLEALGRG